MVEINDSNIDVDQVEAVMNMFVRDVLDYTENQLNVLAGRGESAGISEQDVWDAWVQVEQRVRKTLLPKRLSKRERDIEMAEKLVDRVEQAFERGHVMFAVARPDSEIFDVHCPCGVKFTAVLEELQNIDVVRMAHDDAANYANMKPAESSDLDDTHDDTDLDQRLEDYDPIQRAPDFVVPDTETPAKGPFDFPVDSEPVVANEFGFPPGVKASGEEE